jgi:hypothetical protein
VLTEVIRNIEMDKAPQYAESLIRRMVLASAGDAIGGDPGGNAIIHPHRTVNGEFVLVDFPRILF